MSASPMLALAIGVTLGAAFSDMHPIAARICERHRTSYLAAMYRYVEQMRGSAPTICPCPCCDLETMSATPTLALAIGVTLGALFGDMRPIADRMCERHRTPYLAAMYRADIAVNTTDDAPEPDEGEGCYGVRGACAVHAGGRITQGRATCDLAAMTMVKP
jgi:hypothetical protein